MKKKRDQLAGIVGKGAVFDDPDIKKLFVPAGMKNSVMTPCLIVRPKNTREVQEIVLWANETLTPIIPVSSGPPHYKGAVPGVREAVIVDLSGMNKILKIDRRSRLALIEPGVTWEDLSVELAKHGLRITPPLLARKSKSVIASLLDREPLVSPKYQWNMTEPLRSMEIIFGSGDKIYSGMGGHRGEKDEDWENGTIPVTNAGPHQFDFMKMVTASQGTFGIVTWASVKLETASTEEKALFIEGKSIDHLTDFLYKILKFRIGDEICIFNKKALSSILASESKEINFFEQKLSQWTALVNIKWGALRAKEKIAVQEADVNDIAQEYGLVPSKSVAQLPAVDVTDRILSLSGDNNWKEKVTGASMEIFFLTTLDKIAGQLEKAAEVAGKHSFSFADCPIYLQPLHQGTAVHCHIVLPVPTDWSESDELKNLYNDMSKALFTAGAFYSRPYGIWADFVYDGNSQHTVLTNKMKDIFDPEHILNPGKLCF